MAGTISPRPVRPFLQRRSRAGHGMRRALRGLAGAAALVAVTAVAAHGHHDATAVLRHISGTYAVSAVAGVPVPATVLDTMLADPSGGPAAHVAVLLTSARVRLDPAGTWSLRVDYGRTVNGRAQQPETRVDAGTYVVSGSTVTFRSADGAVMARGILADESLSVLGRLLDIRSLAHSCPEFGCE